VSNSDDKQTPKKPGDAPSDPVPPTLRGRMNLEDETEQSSSSHLANILGIVMLVAIVVLGTLFWTSVQKDKAETKRKAAAAAKAAAEEARTDSLNKVVQDSLQKARADSIDAYNKKHPQPKPKPAAQPQAGATPGAAGTEQAAPPPPPTKFGIDVGSFLTQDRANAEQTKLQAATSLPARVVPTTEDGGTSYHVVIGEFTSRKDAEKKANELIVGSKIQEAHVTKLKP